MAAEYEDVLDYWFAGAEHSPQLAAERGRFWFASSDEVDAEICDRFGDRVRAAMRGELGTWPSTPRGTVALLLLLDQFTRNVFRGTSEAFAADPMALEVAGSLIDSGRDQELPWVYRAFLHLPFEHSESVDDQRRCVELCRAAADAAPAEWKELMTGYIQFSVGHLEVIERFGRFPHRNEVLGRGSTPEEIEYLENAERYGQ